MEAVLLQIALTIAGGLFVVLITIVGWIGSRIHARLDEMSKALQAIERDLRKDLVNLDRRLYAIESQCNPQNGDCTGKFKTAGD